MDLCIADGANSPIAEKVQVAHHDCVVGVASQGKIHKTLRAALNAEDRRTHVRLPGDSRL